LFDDEFNITALLDWSACQTAPLESFLRQPSKVVADADSIENWMWSEWPHWPKVQNGRSKARALFLEVFKKGTAEVTGADVLNEIIASTRTAVAHRLDKQGIMGVDSWLMKPEMEILFAEQQTTNPEKVQN
jgi:hypothetical protein